MRSIYRLWLRFILCEPEEWAEIRYGYDPWPQAGKVERDLLRKAREKRLARYRLAYGDYNPERIRA